MNEYEQADAPDEFQGNDTNGSKSKTKRGTKGDRAGQLKRWRERNPGRYRAYMRRYMAERKRRLIQAPI